MLEALALLAGAGIGGIGLAAAAGVSRAARRRERNSESALEVAQAALREAGARQEDLRRRVDALSGDLVQQTAAADAQHAASEAERAAAEHAARVARRERDELEQRAGRLDRKLSRVQGELADAQIELRRSRQVLRALGVGVPEASRDPLAPEHRAVTRSAIQALVVECGADAAALVRDDGLAALATGSASSTRRLAALAADAAAAEAELEAVLCAPLASWSVMDRRFCGHLLRIPGSNRWIGVENDGVAPLFAMRNAALRAAGLPEATAGGVGTPETVLSLDHAPDARLSAKLETWAARWGADAVTVLDVDGRPLAATRRAQPSAVMALRRRVTPLLLRLARDGRFLDDLALVARAADDAALTLRVAGEDLESPTVAVLARAEIPEHALDDLLGVLRWHVGDTLESREAS